VWWQLAQLSVVRTLSLIVQTEGRLARLQFADMMKSMLSVMALVLLAINGAAGLNCYACRPDRQIAGHALPDILTKQSKGFPRCAEMDSKDPDLRFEMKCPAAMKRCVKIRDEHGNELRSCSGGEAKKCTTTSKSGQAFCICKGDFCNAAATTAPALAALFVPLLAALLRLH